MISIVIKPSGLPLSQGKPWHLAIRQHDLGGTDYSTICRLNDDQAKLLAEEKQVSFLYGAPDWNEHARLTALNEARSLREKASIIERDAGFTPALPPPEANRRRAEIAGIVTDYYRSITAADSEVAAQDLIGDLLLHLRSKGADPATALLRAFADFRAMEFNPEEDAYPALSLVDNGITIAEQDGYHEEALPEYVPSSKRQR